jgi:hypothetical protein
MKYVCVFVLSLMCVGFQAEAQIPAGSRVLLRAQNAVSSRTAKTGDSIYLVTVTPLAAGNRIVVPAGSQARGEVTSSRKSGVFHRRAEMTIELRDIILPGGVSVHAAGKIVSSDPGWTDSRSGAGAMDRIAWGSAGTPLAVGALTAVLSRSGNGFRVGTGAALGLRLALLAIGHGREVEIRASSLLEATLEAPVSLTR